MPPKVALSAPKAYPFSDTKLAKYLSKQIDGSEKSQRDIATEIGYEKPNMISMFKRGEAKVPLDKIPALAKALHVDPAHMMRLALEQYWPELWSTVQKVFGDIVTENEKAIYAIIRKELGDDPELDSKLKQALREALKAYRMGNPPRRR